MPSIIVSFGLLFSHFKLYVRIIARLQQVQEVFAKRRAMTNVI
jgi:hypothetical protein